VTSRFSLLGPQCTESIDVFYIKNCFPKFGRFVRSFFLSFLLSLDLFLRIYLGEGKAVPLQAWRGPETSRKLRFTDFMTTAQDGGKVVSLTHRPFYPQEIHLVLISVGGCVDLRAVV
jgi:hypothetical protein